MPSRAAAFPGIFTGVCLLSAACAQPNVVFTFAILVIPVFISQIDRWYSGKHIWRIRVAVVIIGLAAWIVLRNLPLFSDVVSNEWDPYVDGNGFQAFFDYLSLGFRNSVAQPELSVLVVIGIVYALCNRRGSFFLPAYCFFAVAYFFVAMYDPKNVVGSFFSGFWYNDADRIAACGAIAALPLACLGLYSLVCFVEKVIRQFYDAYSARTASVAAFVAILFLIFMPNHILPGRGEVRTALGDRAERLEALATYDGALTREELAFLQDCKSVVGDEGVLNNPYDGSAFAYATAGLDVYFKSFWSINNSVDANMAPWQITRWLYLISDKPAVRDAVEALGMRYVLVLDSSESPNPTIYHFFTYKEGQWQGIMNITDDTPCFEVVLAEGDMRLYRIVC